MSDQSCLETEPPGTYNRKLGTGLSIRWIAIHFGQQKQQKSEYRWYRTDATRDIGVAKGLKRKDK